MVFKKKTFEEFEKDVFNEWGNLYKVYPPYLGSKDKVKVLCNKCENTFEIRPNNLLSGHGCKYCRRTKLSKVFRKTKQQFISEVDNCYGKGHYEILEDYKTANTPTKVKHIDCGNIYYTRPVDFIKGHGCPKCAYKTRALKIGNAHRFNLKQVKEQLKDLLGYDYQLMLNNDNEYKGNRQRVPIKHLKCGNVFTSRMADIQHRGSGCPYCTGSLGEKLINSILKNDYHLNINKDYFCGYVIPNNKLHLDFYFPKLNLAIEYDGKQHYTPIEFFGGEKALMEQKDRDKQKDKYCKNHNIKLIRIPYTNHTYKEIKEVLDSNLSGFM